jgi:hypothetical protein
VLVFEAVAVAVKESVGVIEFVTVKVGVGVLVRVKVGVPD